MILVNSNILTIFLIFVCSLIGNGQTAVPIKPEIRSDSIVTKFYIPNQDSKIETNPTGSSDDENQPGWTRRQLLRFGGLFSEVGNKLGGFSARVTSALDKVCEVIKTIIPVVAAVCHVGQFKFCGSVNDAPKEFADALAPANIDLNIQDK